MTAGETHVRAVPTIVEFFPGRIQIRWQIELNVRTWQIYLMASYPIKIDLV